MRKPWIVKYRELAKFGVILCLLLGSSCAQLSQQPLPETKTPAQLRSDAEVLFLKGEYGDALREFLRIYEASDLTDEDRNQALYGLACTQIVMARTDRELAEGIGNLEKWDEEKGDAPFLENRRLLIFALKQQGNLLVKKNREQQKQESRKDRLIANQKEKIGQLSETIGRLQKQLEELEVIDESFQERRKTL